MRKLLAVLVLAAVLTVTLATPAFADEGKGNMPGNADDMGWYRGLWNSIFHLGWGPWMAGLMSGGMNADPVAYGWYAKAHSFWHIINGEPPAKPHWAGGQ